MMRGSVALVAIVRHSLSNVSLVSFACLLILQRTGVEEQEAACTRFLEECTYIPEQKPLSETPLFRHLSIYNPVTTEIIRDFQMGVQATHLYDKEVCSLSSRLV